MVADSEAYGPMNVADPLGLFGFYGDRDTPIAYEEPAFVSPAQERLREEMAELRGQMSPEQLQLHNALQEQYSQAQPAMRAAPSLTQMQRGFEGMVPAQRKALRAGSAAMANRDAADNQRLYQMMLEQENRARQERLMAAARIRDAKTFSEDFKAMANARSIQQAGVYGEQLAEHKPLWGWAGGSSEKLPADRGPWAEGAPSSEYNSAGGMEI